MKLGRCWLCGLAVLLLVSCSKGKDEMPVAKIKDRVITLARFEEAFQKVDPRYLPDGEGFEQLQKFLEVMVEKEIMAIKADELGFDKDESVRAGIEAFRRIGLQAAYLKFRVADKVEVTEKKLRDYYNFMGTTVTMKQMLLDTEAEANQVRKLLLEGADFETVCKQYSKAPDAEEGGKAMTAVFGRLHWTMQDELFEQPVGGVTNPIESGYGFFVIKVLKKSRSKSAKTFEEVREELEPLVRAQEEKRLMDRRSKEVRRRAGVEWYPENIRIVFEALPPDRPLTSPPKRGEEAYPLLKFDESELVKSLVSYKDKAITIADFSDLYDRSSFFERPRRENRLGGIKGMLMRIVMNELVEDEMERSRIEEQPELKEVLEKKREELMVTRMFEEMVSKQTVITRAEIGTYYEDNMELYKSHEQRRFGVVVTSDEAAAKEAYAKLLAGSPVARVAQLYSIDEQTRENLGETDLVARGSLPELDDVGFNLANIGDISSPFETSRGWVVLKLVERTPERIRPLAEVRGSIELDLKRLKDDSRLKELIAKWKKEIPVEIFEENLKKAELNVRPTRAY